MASHWRTQHHAYPEAERYVAELGILLFAAGREVLRFQRHAAHRAIARMVLLDLGMHRTGIDHLPRFSERRTALQRHTAFRTTACVTLSTPSHIGQKYFFAGSRLVAGDSA